MSEVLGVSIAGLGMASLVVYGLPRWWRVRAVAQLRRVCHRERILVLTYDDGPGAAVTPTILELLADYGATGTFFARGAYAERASELLDRIAVAGHEIGCHSQDHTNAWRVSPSRAFRDAREGFESLARWVAPSGLYRPPHGKIDLFTWARLSSRGVRQAWWTIDSGDTWDELPAIDSIVKEVRASRGGVVLMHDMGRSDERQQFVVDLTEQLLMLAAAEDFSCRPLGALLTPAAS